MTGETVVVAGDGLASLVFAAHERAGDGWVVAVDPSVDALEELLRQAHERDAPGIMYLVGDVEVLPLPDASVDAVVLRSVPVDVDELARVLRPGGRLLLHEPRDVDRLAAALAGWSDLVVEPRHVSATAT